MVTKKKITDSEKENLLKILKTRFEKKHFAQKELKWENIITKLEANPEKLWSLNEMEQTGGEPNLIDYDQNTNQYIFSDCVIESPKERRSYCYDREALESRKQFKPINSVVDAAKEMGIELLNENQYLAMQNKFNFDTKTSSWLATPDETRKLGGAIFGDFRFGRVFIYHNGAESYYAGRGFRGILKL